VADAKDSDDDLSEDDSAPVNAVLDYRVGLRSMTAPRVSDNSVLVWALAAREAPTASLALNEAAKSDASTVEVEAAPMDTNGPAS